MCMFCPVWSNYKEFFKSRVCFGTVLVADSLSVTRRHTGGSQRKISHPKIPVDITPNGSETT